MPQCVIIADDLTGANATGVLLTKYNLKTSTVMNIESMDFRDFAQYDAVTFSTDSRAIEPEVAYERVFAAVEKLQFPEVKLYNKRIDSTLRGNLGTEIDAMLDGLKDKRIAIVVPCFPQAGRIAVGGYLLVNGVMLQSTDAARDAKTPINTSVIEVLIKRQTKYNVQSIFLNTVYSGINALQEKITQAAENGSRVLIIDAVQVTDLEVIADAVIACGIGFITVDPGSFTAVIAKKILQKKEQTIGKKILISVGSVTNLTKIQLDEVSKTLNPFTVYINTDKLIFNSIDREQEIARVVKLIIDNQDKSDLLAIVANSVNLEYRLDFTGLALELQTSEEELSLRINNSIAEISSRILKTAPEIKGIFSSGGDITVALCRKFNSSGMELLREIIPLAAYGKLVGGEFPGLKLVTKGGMVGDKEAMKQCIQYLQEQL